MIRYRVGEFVQTKRQGRGALAIELAKLLLTVVWLVLQLAAVFLIGFVGGWVASGRRSRSPRPRGGTGSGWE